MMNEIGIKPPTREINHVLKEVQSANKQVLAEFFINYPNIHWTQLFYEKTGDTILHCAARLGLVNIIDYLLSKFSSAKSVDCKNKDDKTALHEAAQYSQYKACQRLLEHGANVNALKRADWTPLMLACTKLAGDSGLRTVELLLQNNAIVNYKNKDGWTALHLISREGDARILKALLEHDLDVKLKTKNRRTGLHIAALHGNIDILEILLRLDLNVDEKDSCGNTPLHEAVLGGDIEVCKILINYNADMRNRNNRGYNVLHLAASEGHLEVIDFILNDLEWDINDTTADGFTALHCAVRNKRKEAFEHLISKGADISIKDNCGRTPIFYLE